MDATFSLCHPLKYVLTGKFKASSDEWLHSTRILSDYELIIVTEGTLYLSIDAAEHTLTKGDYLLCPPYAKQFGTKASSCSFYWLHFQYFPFSVLNPINGSTITMPVAQKGTLPHTDKLIVMMKQLQDAVRTYNDPTYSNYLTTIIMIEFFHESLEAQSAAEKKSQSIQLYNDVMDYVKWNINANLKVVDIAAHFGYNPKYLSHVFNAIAGRSLKQYIITEKIARAKFMLSDTNHSILFIAETLGFNDSHNFMKLFKKHVGLTPTEYRNAYNKRMLFYV